MKHLFILLSIVFTPFFLIAEKIDIVVFSFNRPMQLYSMLESLEKHVEGYHSVHVIYRHIPEYAEGYAIVKEDFPNAVYYKQDDDTENARLDFKPFVMTALYGPKSLKVPYVIFSTDDLIVKAPIHLQEDLRLMQEAHAIGFYYRLGANITESYSNRAYSGTPPFIELGYDTLGWQISQGKHDWHYPNTVDFTLYDKQSLFPIFHALSFYHPNSLEGNWAAIKTRGLALCKRESKIVNIPMNIVTDYENRQGHIFTDRELYEKFMDGYKIDLTSIEPIRNKAPHWEITPTFIKR